MTVSADSARWPWQTQRLQKHARAAVVADLVDPDTGEYILHGEHERVVAEVRAIIEARPVFSAGALRDHRLLSLCWPPISRFLSSCEKGGLIWSVLS